MKNYYKILGINTDADKRAIRQAWLSKAKITHPDHNPEDPTSEELFKEAQEAYHILSDPFLKSRYDSGMLATKLTVTYDDQKPVTYYFYSKTDFSSVKQYEEFPVQFTYIGKGRIFKKPTFDNFFITGSPYISHRLITHEGHPLKETTFTYMLCPMKTGSLTIGPAFININNETLQSEPIQIVVTKNKCHFSENSIADGKPLKLIIHFDDMNYSGGTKRNHTLLIPRSRNARSFHIIGMVMKIVFIIWGGIMLSYYINVSFAAGITHYGV